MGQPDQATPAAFILAPGVTPTQVSLGDSSGLAIGSDGNLYVWGDGGNGELGDGETTNHFTPEETTLAPGVKPTAIADGDEYGLAIGSDGNLYAWGNNGNGQLGDGTTTNHLTPEVITLAPGVTPRVTPTAISAGADGQQSLAIGSDGNVYAWGGNAFLFATNTLSPQLITIDGSPFSATAISESGLTSFAIGSDGNLYVWGDNDLGAFGDGTEGSGEISTPQVVTLAPGVTPTAIADGGAALAAIGSNGQLYSWGLGGTVGDGTTNSVLTPEAITLAPGVTPTAISEGTDSAMAIGSDGQLYTWGDIVDGMGNGADELSPVVTNLAPGVTPTAISTATERFLVIGVGPSSTVTFNANAGTGTMATETEIAPVALTTNAYSRAGYTFAGWNTAADGSGTTYADGATYAFSANATLYAQWSANATDDYNYAAGTGTGSAPASGSGLDGTTITLATNTFTDPGLAFAGWSDDTTTYPAGSTYTLSSGGAAITFTAQWTPNTTDTVTFNSEGGSAVGPLSGPDGTAITLPTAPTFAGHSFDGWFTAPTGGSALTSPYTLAGSVTLFAQWTAAPTTAVLIPSAGATLSGTATTLDASASNATSVKFLLFGGTFGFNAPVLCTATATLYGWLCAWNTTTVPNGSYALVSEASGAGGSTFSSSGVSMTVKNPLPTTSVLIPSTGATLSGTATTLDASASNATSVEFLLFGGTFGFNAPVLCTATATLYGWLCAWNTTTVPNGSYALVSEAFNTTGSTFSSSGVSMTVKN